MFFNEDGFVHLVVRDDVRPNQILLNKGDEK